MCVSTRSLGGSGGMLSQEIFAFCKGVDRGAWGGGALAPHFLSNNLYTIYGIIKIR